MASTITDRLAGLSTSVAVKAPVVAATTAAITLSGTQTIDGVAVVAGDRVLVKNQTSSAENGIYYVDSLTWSRAEDMDGNDDIVNGTTVYVTGGTANGDNWFNATLSSSPPVIGTTGITWAATYVSLTAVSNATESVAGVVELATQTETNTGTNDTTVITPLKLATNLTSVIATQGEAEAGSNNTHFTTPLRVKQELDALMRDYILIPVTGDSSLVTTGTGKVHFRMPFAMTVTAVRASLTTAQSSGNILTIDINDSGTTILSTKLTIDNTEKTSTTAATAAVISDTDLADDAEITIDVDQVGAGDAAGLKVLIGGYRA